MTPKEKAESLVEKFLPHTLVFDEGAGWLEDKDEAKQCALIAVDEIIEALYEYDEITEKYLKEEFDWMKRTFSK